MKRLNGEGTSEFWVTLRRRKITRLSNSGSKLHKQSPITTQKTSTGTMEVALEVMTILVTMTFREEAS